VWKQIDFHETTTICRKEYLLHVLRRL